jgi:hypothetical protein
MKIKFTFFMVFCATVVFAQNKLFQNSVSEKNLATNQKISKGLSETYSSTNYYQQPSFNLKSDFELTLPKGKVIKGKYVKTFSYSNKSESSVYSVQNEPDSDFVLSKADNIVTGMYTSISGEKVIFHQTDQNVFAISTVNESYLINKDSTENSILDETAITQKVNADICLASTPICPATTVVDIMVVFTPQAKTAWGGLAQSKSFVATAITNFNTSLTSSGVNNLLINLVYCEEITYSESGNISTDLTRFRTEGDGFMDTVASLRSSYGADLCALVTSTPTNTCGLGYVNNSNTNYSANSAFCVGIYSCVVSNFSLAHEYGHNMGLQHDWYVNNSTNPCEHHHGYTNKTAINLGAASTSSQRWRTIMAYNTECADAGISCTRINRWSNPGLNYNTEPTGIAIGQPKPSNEAFGFVRFGCVVGAFMPTQTLATFEIVNNVEFAIYPNPAKDELNVQIKNSQYYTFKITNLVGQVLLKSVNKTIDLQGLASGEYLLSIYNKENTLLGTKKFLVK